MSDTFNTYARPESGRKLTTRDITVCALSIALITVCSWISIPMTIPFTLQTFAVCLIAALLGARRGVISVLAYILLGAIGVPVFAGFKGGIGSLLGPTGGYIIGFIFTAFIAGLAAEHFGRKLQILIPAMILGILICYAFGTAWFVIMKDGEVQQIGTPEEVFDDPVNVFVAGFIGMPQMNMFDGEIVKKGEGSYAVKVGKAEIPLSEEKQKNLAKNHIGSQKALIGCRPEHITLDKTPGAMIEGKVDVSEMMGSSVHLHINAEGKDCIIIVPTLNLNTAGLVADASVEFTFAPNAIHMFDPETEKNLECK